MGGRGAFLRKKASERIPEYKSVGIIEGIKVLKPVKGQNNLPAMSNTPGTRYLLMDDNNNFKQLRIYDNSRHLVVDIDYGHSPNGSDILHIHFWKGGRSNNVRNLTSKDLKKYGRILRQAGIKI